MIKLHGAKPYDTDRWIHNVSPGTLFQWGIFLSSIVVSIIFQKHLFVGKFGWLFLALLSAVEPKFAVYAVFFFSAFFHSTGFLPHLFFTIKHFHVAVGLLFVILLIRSELFSRIKSTYKSAAILLVPWMLLILTSSVASLFWDQAPAMRAFLTNANVFSLVLSAAFLVCVISERQVIINGLFVFTFGVALRVFLSMPLHIADQFYFGEDISFNNHIGFLSASSIFILFSLALSAQPKYRISYYSVSSALLLWIFAGLILSCSRTGWIAFCVSFTIFIFFFNRMRTSPSVRDSVVSRYFILGALIVLFGMILASFFISQDVHGRISAFSNFARLDYWKQILTDQNFGCFGFFRMHQFISIKELLKTNWLMGVGFGRQITDFHSLYLTVLGGTGVIGLVIFLTFVIKWSRLLIDELHTMDDGCNLFRLGVFSAFVVWLVYSFMETFIVQFNIWMLFAVGTILRDKKQVSLLAEQENISEPERLLSSTTWK